ncbi:hypothetical protein [Aquimarina macrocephali]|uniref:hypothetical protein n=1 Tax=Aquimarina macrocephali TaxID=666563 RepID=UPI000463B595|nr:hypothetical protein [Aquimarina macrocephali]
MILAFDKVNKTKDFVFFKIIEEVRKPEKFIFLPFKAESMDNHLLLLVYFDSAQYDRMDVFLDNIQNNPF